MKSKQVLDIKQMKRLQELGLDTSDASFYIWRWNGSCCNQKMKYNELRPVMHGKKY